MLKLHSIETFGTNEGPGIRTILFLQGCKLKCLYCHNPDTISSKGGKETSNEEILKIIEKDKIYFGKKGGITVSGGEPLLQAKDLIPLFKELKIRGFNTTIDTNGFILNDNVKELLNYTDLVLLDIKHMNNAKHKILTGVNNENIFKFADYLKSINKNFWVRHVLVPSYTDDDKHIESLGKYLKDFKNLERLEILPYHTLGKYKWKELGMKYGLEGIDSPTKENIENCKNILKQYIDNVYVRS